ncbi:MAG: nucleotidyltransferase domain-containing protein [Chthoniobacteraceae bacterium]
MPPRFRNLDKLHLPPRPPDASSHLERMLTALVEDFGAERIIVFGSCARGGVNEHSDLDLCVVRDHLPGCTHPNLIAGLAVAKVRPLLSKDNLVRTPEQFRCAADAPFGVMEEVIRHGLTVYER